MNSKLEYISRMLTKISHKRLESYVIYRIWNGLNRTDIRFDFQQYVRRRDGKYALADMYLPQINLTVEVNEPAHYYNMKDDEDRRSDVTANGVKVLNVDCYNIVNDSAEECTLEELNERTDLVIEQIKEEITKREKSGNFIPWEMHHIVNAIKKRGVLRVEDYISVNTIDEIADIFGAHPKHKGYLRAGGADIPGKTDLIVWWPSTNSSVWENEVNQDETKIIESNNNPTKNERHLNEYLNSAEQRVTFIKDTDWLGNKSYRFIGVFELNHLESEQIGKCVWDRLSTTYYI